MNEDTDYTCTCLDLHEEIDTWKRTISRKKNKKKNGEGVSIFVIRQCSHSLLIHRRSHRLKNASFCWSVPGGYVDQGETFLEAAIRELREEAGLDLSQLEEDRFIEFLDETDVDGNRKVCYYVVVPEESHAEGPEHKFSWEIVRGSTKWVPLRSVVSFIRNSWKTEIPDQQENIIRKIEILMARLIIDRMVTFDRIKERPAFCQRYGMTKIRAA